MAENAQHEPHYP